MREELLEHIWIMPLCDVGVAPDTDGQHLPFRYKRVLDLLDTADEVDVTGRVLPVFLIVHRYRDGTW